MEYRSWEIRGAPLRRKVTDYGYEVLEPNSAVSAQDSTGLALLPSAGLTIVLQGTAQLEANPTAKAAFITAANRWESVISTPVTITLSVDYGPQFFGTDYSSASIIGQTGSFSITSSLAILRSRLINSNPSASELQLYNALPSDSVPVDLNGTASTVSNFWGFSFCPGTLWTRSPTGTWSCLSFSSLKARWAVAAAPGAGS